MKWKGPTVLACGCTSGMGVPGLCTRGRRLYAIMQAARHEATVNPSLEAEGQFIAARQALARHIELGTTMSFAPLSLMPLSARQRARLRMERWRYVRGQLNEGGHPHERLHITSVIETATGLATVIGIWAMLGYLAVRAI